MNDLRIELRFKNATLCRHIEERFASTALAMKSVKAGAAPLIGAASEAMGVTRAALSGLMRLSQSPWAYGRWSDSAQTISAYLNVPETELFPLRLYANLVGKVRPYMEVDSNEFLSLKSAEHLAIAPSLDAVPPNITEAIDGTLKQLTPLQEKIIRLRFGLDGEPQTLESIGDEMGRSGERIRMIEAQALARLRKLAKPLARIYA